MLQVSRFLNDKKIIYSNICIDRPSVSVIMPTYCRGEISLRRSIESVLNQTFRNFEFIIIVDGSRDKTFEIIKEYQNKDPRIVIVNHKYNCGLPALRINEGIMEAKGKYICYQFDDDEYFPFCLETLYNEIIKHDEPCVVYGNSEMNFLANHKLEKKILGGPFNYGLLLNSNFIPNNSVIHHKSIFDNVGLYDPHIVIRRFTDYDLWLRIGKKFPFFWINKIITKVFVGGKYSLGRDINLNLGHIRKYIEIPREKLLLPECINQYEVDKVDLDIYKNNFTESDIDYLNRNQIIPFRSTIPYYLEEHEIAISNISRPRKRTLAITKGDFSTSVDVTIRNFTNRIQNFPFNYFFIKEQFLEYINNTDYDILGLYRTIGNVTNNVLRENINVKKPTAYIMDDNMFKMHELGKEFDYLKPDTIYNKNLQYQVTNSHVVFSYNPVISQDCINYNRKVIELKTNIPAKYLRKKEKTNHKAIKIAMFSGEIRKNELKKIWPALVKISEKYKRHIEFHFWGINPKEFGKLQCPTYHLPFTHSYDHYLNKLSNSYFDFHICPLDGIYDASRSKSIIKFLEGTVTGAVGIFSNVEPYRSIPDNLCFKVENSTQAWYEILEKVIQLKNEERAEIYNRAFNYISQNYSTESQANTLLSALEAAELIASLGGRKIAYFFHESYLGGATLHLLKHALIAKHFGIKIILCLPNEQKIVPDLQDIAKKYGLEIAFLSYRNFVEIISPTLVDINNAKIISKWLTQNNIGLVHSITYNPSVGIAAKMNGIPHVASLHQFYKNKTSKTELMKNLLIDIIHCSSIKFAKNWSENLHINARKIVCPVETQYFQLFTSNKDRIINKNKNIKILLAGTIQIRKNQLNAIKAISILKKRGYNVQLDLIGYESLIKDYTELCKKEISVNNLHQVVKIHGFINEPQKFYNNYSDILLCCSTDESMPQVILQAMASGVLVVSTEVGGIKEIVKDNYSGIIAEGPDAHLIANAIEKAINLNDGEKKELIINANKTVKMIAHPDHVSSELLNLYNEAFEQEKRHPCPELVKQIQKI